MKRAVAITIGFAVVLAGCASLERGPRAAGDRSDGRRPSPAATKAATWEMPPEFRPSTARAATQDALYTANFPRLGTVRGQRDELLALNKPLGGRRGVSRRAFNVCRGLIANAAKAYGATRVEAAAAGRQKRISGGGYEAPMAFRILYPTSAGYELRQARIRCQLDASYTPVATPIIPEREPIAVAARNPAAVTASLKVSEPVVRQAAAPAWEMPTAFRPTPRAAAGRGGYHVVTLPNLGEVRGTREHLLTLRVPLRNGRGVSRQAFQACEGLIQTAAKSLGAVKVEAAVAGPQRKMRGGGVEAPMEFRILYRTDRGHEVRQAKIGCQLDANFAPVATPVLSA